MATAFHSIDYSHWPRVQVSLVRAPSSTQDIEEFQKDFLALLQLAVHGATDIAPIRLQLIMILDGLVHASFEQQMSAVSFMSKVQPLVQAGAVEKTAMVVTNPDARFVLNNILTFVTLSAPHVIVDSVMDAVEWLTATTHSHNP